MFGSMVGGRVGSMVRSRVGSMIGSRVGSMFGGRAGSMFGSMLGSMVGSIGWEHCLGQRGLASLRCCLGVASNVVSFGCARHTAVIKA